MYAFIDLIEMKSDLSIYLPAVISSRLDIQLEVTSMAEASMCQHMEGYYGFLAQTKDCFKSHFASLT